MRMQRKWRGGVLCSLIFSLLLAGCSGEGGTGSTGIAPTVETPPVAANQVNGLHGRWTGMSSNGRKVWGVIVDSKYYFWYSAIGDPTTLRGGITGQFVFDLQDLAQGTLSSPNAVDFSMDDKRVWHATLTAAYVPKQTLTGTMVVEDGGSVTFTLAYEPDSGTTPGDPGPIGVAKLEDIVGTYDGPTEWNLGKTPATITIAPDGTFTVLGYLDGFGGYGWETFTCPNTDGVISIQYWGATAYQFRITQGCLYPQRGLGGAALFDPTTQRLYLFAWSMNISIPSDPQYKAFIRVITKRP